MFGITGIIHLIGQALGIANNLTSGENSEKRLHVAVQKNAGKALNIAEDIFDLVDAQIAVLPLDFKRKYYKLKKKFNDLD